ncbi:histidinol-phosphate transaminase [Paraferrimonas sp. SM1919]|uniref:histidinol-phosphate transaminase n=1 Tax=Paraferrimonas sp. SM1919 TaxID=2662263 RepID=UPI0013D6F808|nr:histidinol-phosphate transaminase [Paraferrimonas sp. SM1919]
MLNLDKLINQGVAGLHPYQPGKPIEELERELGITNIVKLASNENPLGIGPRAKQAIKSAIEDLTRYPDGSGHDLKQALAQQHGLGSDQFTLGNGSNEVLEMIFRTFVGSGDNVVYSQYAFIVYKLLTQGIGAEHREIPAQSYGHDLEAMLAAIDVNTKLVCVANPNNPTGTFIEPQVMAGFIAAVPKQTLIVLDEAYTEYLAASERLDIAQLLNKHDNLIVCRTFSKAYGLAGLRIGYAMSSQPISSMLNRVREPFNNNTLALVAAEASLQDESYLQTSVRLNAEQMQLLEMFLQQKGIEYIPSKGNFICIKVGPQANDIYQQLLKLGVIVRPVAGYGLADYLRVSIGTESENRTFMDAMNLIKL